MAVIGKNRKRILVIKTRAIGDTVLLSGTLRVLKKRFPRHQIEVLAGFPGAQLLEGLSFIDRLICVKEPKGKLDRLAYWIRLVHQLRRHRYDYVLNFHASVRTAFMGRLLRRGKFVANHHQLNGPNWFSEVEVPGRGVVKPNIDRDLDVLRALKIEGTSELAQPEIRLSSAEKQNAFEKLVLERKLSEKTSFLFLGIGASRKTKKWPPGHFVRFIRYLSDKTSFHFVIASIDEDHSWLEEFYANLDMECPYARERIHHFQSQTLRRTASLMSHCDGFVGNDSGLKHIGVALGLPTVSLFGPEAPLEWHPYDTQKHPIFYISDLKCRTESGKHWCSLSECVKHQNQCMSKIEPETVASQIIKLTREFALAKP